MGAALAVSALCVATAKPFRDATIDSIVLTDEQANQAYGLMELIPGVFDMIEKLRPVIEENFESIVLSDDEAKEAYGILDLIPGVGELIEKLRPLIEEKIQILLDPNMDMNQKIYQIIEVCKQHAPEIVKIVGDFGLKVIIQTILPGIIASMGR